MKNRKLTAEDRRKMDNHRLKTKMEAEATRSKRLKRMASFLMLLIFSVVAVSVSAADFSKLKTQNKGSVTMASVTVAMAVALPAFTKKGKDGADEFVELKGEDLTTFMKDAEPEQIGEYMTAKQAHYQKVYEDALKDKASKEDLQKALDEVRQSNSDLAKSVLDGIKQHNLLMKKAIDSSKHKDSYSEKAAEIKTHLDAMKALASKTSNTEITLKALTTRSIIVGNEEATTLPDIGQLATRKLSLYDLFPKITINSGTHNGIIRYYDWDEATKVRAAAAVAEAAAFPESTAAFKAYTIPMQKIGDTLPVTEEFFEDEQLFAAELEMFLKINVALEIDRQLALGDGTGNQIIGIIASVPVYVPVASGIPDANIYDLAVKVGESITKTGGSKFSPNFMLMNITTINRMKLKKDGFNNYMLPPFVSDDGKNVAGMVVVESNIFPDGTAVIGDNRFGRIYEMGGVVISRGEVNAQFTSDEMTLKARKRMLFLIRNCDQRGFAYVSDIDAALVTLQS